MGSAVACGDPPRGSGTDTDAGTETDTGTRLDTGTRPDTGTRLDTGTPPSDVGTPKEDSGIPAEDSGIPAEDSGPPVEDTGIPAEDTGIPAEDTGTPAADSGTPAEDTGIPVTDTGIPVTDTGNPVVDVPTTTDTGNPTMDTGTPTDVPVVLPDVTGPSNPCAAGAVIDLNAVGMRMGETTRYTGNNNNTSAVSVLPSACVPTAGHQLVLRYVPRASTRLRISTDNAGTGTTFDTVVYVQRMCAPSGGDAGPQDSLGCNDDGSVSGSPRQYASALTTEAVTAGQAVFVVVAGYLNSAGQPISGFMPRGTFELSVTEIATVAVGAACDPAGQTNTCAAGAYCYTASGASTCRAFVAAGGACNTTDARCATDNTCVTATGATMGTCRANGTAPGAACLATAPRCTAPLECTSTTGTGTCLAVVATGGVCSSTARCATGNTCVTPAGATMGTCRANGTAEGTTCRSDSPRCTAPLECNLSNTTCITVVATGGMCSSTARCSAGNTCVTETGMTTGTCRADGTVAGAACRETAPRCGTGLECSVSTGAGICRAVLSAGQPCVLASTTAPCGNNTLCAPNSPNMGVCTAAITSVTPGTMPVGAPASAASRVYGGSFAAMGQHCYGVTVPMGGSIFVQSGLSNDAACANQDPIIRVYTPTGTLITSFDDTTGFGLCSVGNPATAASLRGLAAGTYGVCITGFSNRAVMNYLLSVGVIPPAP